MKNKLLLVVCILCMKLSYTQTIQLTNLSSNVFCSTGKDTLKFSVNYSNIPANSNIVFYQSTNPSFNPYAGQGDSIGFINIGGNTAGGTQIATSCPEILGLFIDACNPDPLLEQDNEYIVITSGQGFLVNNLQVDVPSTTNKDINIPLGSNLFGTPSAALMTQLRIGTCNASNLFAAGPGDSIPPNAIVIIFPSVPLAGGSVYNYNFSSYCSSGQPIYILQNSYHQPNGSFANNPPGSCPGATRSTVVKNRTCSSTLTYDPCTLPAYDNTNPNANDGNYTIKLPNNAISTTTNGGIKNNATDLCNGLRYDSLVGNTIIKYPIPNDGGANPATNFCNTGVHYIKAITHPNGSQPVSNAIQFQLVCLDVATNVSNLSICSGSNAAVSISSSDPNATFSWTVSGGAGISGANAGSGNTINQTLTYSGSTKDSLTYNITAKDGSCTKTTSVKVVVSKCNTNPCDSWLYLGDTPSGVTCGDLDIVGDKVTVECTFNKIPGVVSPHLVSKHQVPSAVNYAIGPLNCEITTTNNGYVLLWAPCPPDSQKTYHVAMVYDGAVLKYYRNGYLVASTPCSGNLVNNDIITTIGQINQATGPNYEQFKGYMNEVRIWNVARTQQELRTFMATSLPNPTTQTGLKGYYVFNDLLNKQGNAAYNATIIGTGQINKTNPQCTFVADSCSTCTAFNLGQDTTYCGPFSRVLSTNNSNTVWSTGVTAASITVNTAGNYYATCGTFTDTIKISQSNGINFDFGASSTSVCIGGNISLDASTAYDTYHWNTGATTHAITITQPGRYWVDVFKNGCKGTDTIDVLQIDKEPKPNLGADINTCSPLSQLLSTGKSNTTWYYNFNAASVGTGASYTATQFGTYVAKVSNSCGDVYDTIVITQTNAQPAFNLGNDTTYCGPFSRTLSTGNAATVWNTGVTAASITVTQPGKYYATINVGCGIASDTIVINQGSGVSFDFGSPTTSVCVGGNISLDASTAYDSYHWNTGATTHFITITQPGIYWVDVFKNGCKASDTIQVLQITKPAKPSLGRDTSYCGYFSQVLSTGDAQTDWYRNQTLIASGASLTVNQGGTYVAKVSNSCGSTSDTLVISSGNALAVDLGRDTAICTGNSITLKATVAGNNITYSWNTGATTSAITVNQFGKYDVTVSNGICTVYDTILVDIVDPPVIASLGPDTSFCGNFSFSVFTGDAGTIWSTGVVGPSINVTQAGTYIAENRNQCGSAKDTIVIKQYALPQVELGKDSTVCDSIQLSVGNGTYVSILWSTGDTTPSIIIATAGLYKVTVTNANCANTDSVRIRSCFYDVYIPNAFSPNNDNVNDVFIPLSYIKGIQIIDFQIFNRWGEKVYEAQNFTPSNNPNDNSRGWNGIYKGEPAQVDEYVYYFSAKMPDGQIKIYKGTFALLR